MLEEVDYAELEDVPSGLAEDSVHSNLLNTPIVLDTVAILVHILPYLNTWHINA